MQDIKIGDLVVSIAGHDMGYIYIVYDVLPDNYVLLVDGKSKTIDNPKKKKIKHILSLGENDENFQTKILSKDIENNAYIKKILKNFEKI